MIYKNIREDFDKYKPHTNCMKKNIDSSALNIPRSQTPITHSTAYVPLETEDFYILNLFLNVIPLGTSPQILLFLIWVGL